MPGSLRRARRVLVVCWTITVSLGIAGCKREGSPATSADRAAATRRVARDTVLACTPLGAHAAHQGGFFTCDLCHPCGGVLAIASATLSDGFQVSGTVTRDVSGGATCTVTCHGSQAVSWTGGSLGCSNCHGQWQSGSPVASAHGIDPSQGLTANQAVCTSCHSTADHFDPNMAIVNADTGAADLTSVATPGQVTVFCTSCHDGLGKTIRGLTPPPLLGYATTTGGDFHGARAGTGFGSTLLAPFQVGQGALDCTWCHDPHASTNAFLFAPTVNGASVQGGAITRAGMGAEALCASCHDAGGDFHAGCKVSGCHDGVTVITSATDGVSRPISAALATASGKPCFFCHGHEGIVNFSMPTWDNHPNASGNYCQHCHSHWFPTTIRTTAPAIQNLSVTSITTTSAKIVWDTDVPATTYVERGTTDLRTIEGDPTLVTHHEWTIGGLAQGTAYVYRVRSSDALRNFAEAPAQAATFTTASPGSTGVEPAPTGLHAYSDPGFLDVVSVAQPGTTATVTLKWSAVTSPVGATKYRVTVSSSSLFSSTLYGPADVTTTSTSFTLTGLQPYPGATFYWKVVAIDTGSGAQSAPTTASFQAYSYDPYGG